MTVFAAQVANMRCVATDRSPARPAISGIKIGLAASSTFVLNQVSLQIAQTTLTFLLPEWPWPPPMVTVGATSAGPVTGQSMIPCVWVVLASLGNISLSQSPKMCSLDIFTSGGWRSQKMQRPRPFRNAGRLPIYADYSRHLAHMEKGRPFERRPSHFSCERIVHEHPVVLPHVSHFMQVPLRTRVKLPHSPHISPS